MLKTLNSDDVINIFRDQIIDLAYAGFSPADTYETLRKLGMSAKISAKQFVEDIIALLSYYIARGTTIQRRGVQNSSTMSAQTTINTLLGRYRVQDNVTLNYKGKNVITISRVMNTFPEIVGKMFAKGLKAPIGTKGIIPKGLMFPGGAALIPASNQFDWLYEKFLDWAVTFDKVINRLRRQAERTAAMANNNPPKGFDPKESRENQRSWSDIARTSGRMSDENRARWLKTYLDDFNLGFTIDNDGRVTSMDQAAYGEKS
jgi:hypothetical protein